MMLSLEGACMLPEENESSCSASPAGQAQAWPLRGNINSAEQYCASNRARRVLYMLHVPFTREDCTADGHYSGVCHI